jgi:hypothetical protein
MSRQEKARDEIAGFLLNGDADAGQRMARPVVGAGAAVSAVRVFRGVRTLN